MTRGGSVIVAALLLGLACVAGAQDGAAGKYVGSITAQANGREVEIGLTMVISSVESGRIKGVATMGGQSCGGDYPFEGFLKGTEIGVRSTVKGGRAGDCSFGMRGTLDGGRIVGTIGSSPLRLSKSQ